MFKPPSPLPPPPHPPGGIMVYKVFCIAAKILIIIERKRILEKIEKSLLQYVYKGIHTCGYIECHVKRRLEAWQWCSVGKSIVITLQDRKESNSLHCR